MATPILGIVELVEAQYTPEQTVNEQTRVLEAFSGYIAIADRDLTAPPGSPSDGDRYLVGASATGAWAGHDGEIALYASGWLFYTMYAGLGVYVQDEGALFVWSGSALVSPIGGESVTTESGTSYTLDIDDANGVKVLTNAGAITLTIPPESSVAFPIGTKVEIHQGGAGAVTVSEGSGVTLLSRDDAFTTNGTDAVAGIRKVASDTWRMTGDVV